MSTPIRTFLSAAAVAAILIPASAMAERGRGGGLGEGYINDLQKRPDLIEPWAGNDPSRYRISNPRAGYEDRQLAREGFVNEGSGYYPPRARGRVFVQPYHSR